MEKKILIGLSLIAAFCLVWVFLFLSQENTSDFTQRAHLEAEVEPCSENSSSPCPAGPLLQPGFATYVTEQTSYVLRPEQAGADRVEKMRVQVGQPTAPLPASTGCEQKRIKQLQAKDAPGFMVESMRVQRTGSWPEEYEIYYQRLEGSWSDLEASLHPLNAQDKLFLETVLKSHSAFIESEPSI